MAVTYRLYKPEDINQVVDLLQGIFRVAPGFNVDAWQRLESHDHMTIVAVEENKIVGAIPFDLRDFLLRPGLSIRAAFAHLVGVHAQHRDRRIGSGIMDYAKKLLPQHCEAMFVYTGHEYRPPYTFYARNGFVDLQYSRFYKRKKLILNYPQVVDVQPFDPLAIGEEVLNSVYQKVYNDHAGFRVHYPGYWQKALKSIIFVEIPTEMYIAMVRIGSELAGYAIFGFVRGHVTILEMAADPADLDLNKKLLQAVIAKAHELGAEYADMLASAHHPAKTALHNMRFKPEPRLHAQIPAGFVLNFQRLWTKLTDEKAPFSLKIWTPNVSMDLPGAGKKITLEMKEYTLHRLFLCREDFKEAYEAERTTSPDAHLPVKELTQIFKPARWIYHWLEWI